jgi:3-phosphoshikimate 1-carboxyvinyltransferase
MGASVRVVTGGKTIAAAEPMGDLLVKSSSLKGTIVKKEEVPFLIDELPILMVAGCFASGKTIFEGVQELRVKETDRIKSMVENLREMGAFISVAGGAKPAPSEENIIIEGGKPLKGANVKSYADHRTAMSMIVAAMTAQGSSEIDEVDCINKSFPNFLSILKNLRRDR